jgi:hypothetical protein
MHENRETSGAPQPEREGGRFAKVQSHTADTYALEESDRAIVSMNQANKEERSSAEPGEKRARAKENIVMDAIMVYTQLLQSTSTARAICCV